MQLEHSFSGFGAWEGDVYSLLESAIHPLSKKVGSNCENSPSFDGVIELPRDIGGTKDQDSRIIVADTIHLNQKLRLDSP